MERLLGHRNKGGIIKVSKEKIRPLSEAPESESQWGPINLFEQHPLAANEYGQHLQISPKYHKQLRDLDVSVGLINIAKVRPYRP